MAQDSDDVAEDDTVPVAQVKVETNAKSGDGSFFEKESQKVWSSVSTDQGVAPKLLGLGVIIAIVMIILKKRSTPSKGGMHEKSLA